MKPTSLITFLLDRSGSMASCKEATIEAFNAYLCGLQAETEAAIDFTFLQFDNQSLDKIHVAVPVATAQPLTQGSYVPRGGTPLVDAAVKTIHAVEDSLTRRDDKPRVVICIQTDGEENSSHDHTWEELRGLITMKQAEGWEFNFLGAGIDAYAQATHMGIAAVSTMSYDETQIGTTRAAFAASAANHASFSAGRSANVSYSASARAASGDRFRQGDGSRPAAIHTSRPMPAAASLDLTKRGAVLRPKKADLVL